MVDTKCMGCSAAPTEAALHPYGTLTQQEQEIAAGRVSVNSNSFVLEKLREQEGFLKKSLSEFYAGDYNEAIRIAVIVRVLLHESASSKPLLKQLTPNYLELPINDRQVRKDPRIRLLMDLPIGFRFSSEGVRPFANEEPPDYGPSKIGLWWTRVSLVVPGFNLAFSRKEITLTLANKEGGAHVDPKLPPKYTQLLASKPIRFVVDGNEVRTDTMNLARWACGQIGTELLGSLRTNFPQK
jgi:hypothetical protein